MLAENLTLYSAIAFLLKYTNIVIIVLYAAKLNALLLV